MVPCDPPPPQKPPHEVQVLTEGATAGRPKRRLARGLNASPGIATGQIVFQAAAAIEAAARGAAVVLVRTETSAEDVGGMRAAVAILTTRGGLTGDAAIVARSLGKPCVAGCSSVVVDFRNECLTVLVDGENSPLMARVTLRAGDVLTIDGTTGTVFEG